MPVTAELDGMCRLGHVVGERLHLHAPSAINRPITGLTGSEPLIAPGKLAPHPLSVATDNASNAGGVQQAINDVMPLLLLFIHFPVGSSCPTSWQKNGRRRLHEGQKLKEIDFILPQRATQAMPREPKVPQVIHK